MQLRCGSSHNPMMLGKPGVLFPEGGSTSPPVELSMEGCVPHIHTVAVHCCQRISNIPIVDSGPPVLPSIVRGVVTRNKHYTIKRMKKKVLKSLIVVGSGGFGQHCEGLISFRTRAFPSLACLLRPCASRSAQWA